MCIIGAGKAGLIACKVLHQRGVLFDCFETGSQVCSEVPVACICACEHSWHSSNCSIDPKGSCCIIPLACLECTHMHMQIGGLWVLNNDSGRSACYDSLCINTSKLMTKFHDFPMPEHYPMYCTHEQVSPAWT